MTEGVCLSSSSVNSHCCSASKTAGGGIFGGSRCGTSFVVATMPGARVDDVDDVDDEYNLRKLFVRCSIKVKVYVDGVL